MTEDTVADETGLGDAAAELALVEQALAEGALAEDTLVEDTASELAVAPAGLPPLELRVLSGMHAGARAPLQGDRYMLGALGDCDFVLADTGVQPHHACLSRVDGGWQLDWVAEAGDEPVLAPTRLEHGKAVPLGPLVVAVDDPQAPWPTLEQLVLVPHAPALEPSLPLPSQPAPPSDGPGVAGDWRGRARAAFARRTVTTATAFATAGLSALALVAWPMGLGQAPGQAPQPGGAQGSTAVPHATAVPDPAQRQAIDKVLAELGLAGLAKVEPAANGWQVQAPVMNDAQGESLSAALSRIHPRPALRMTTEQELRDGVADMLVRLAPEYRGKVSLRHLGEGRFRLEGRMAHAAERDKLLRALGVAFPQVSTWDNALVTNEEAAQALLADLATRGWQATGELKEGTLEIEVRLQQRDVPQWERTLLSLAQPGTVPFRATLAFVSPPVAAPGAEARLPFQIRSVVGGDMPYVLLPGGERLAQGGTWQGWRLAGVSGNQVVFENGARRAVVQR